MMKSVSSFSRLGLAAVPSRSPAARRCRGSRHRQSTPTTPGSLQRKVARAFVKVPELSVSEIKVDAFQGEVRLSGFVADAGDVGRAAAVAGGIDGVKAMKNDILVK